MEIEEWLIRLATGMAGRRVWHPDYDRHLEEAYCDLAAVLVGSPEEPAVVGESDLPGGEVPVGKEKANIAVSSED